MASVVPLGKVRSTPGGGIGFHRNLARVRFYP